MFSNIIMINYIIPQGKLSESGCKVHMVPFPSCSYHAIPYYTLLVIVVSTVVIVIVIVIVHP